MANIFKFKPLLKQTIWGGERIAPFKRLECNMGQVGESWEISGVKGQETVVDGGPYDGLTTNELVATLRDRLLGRDNYLRYGDDMPELLSISLKLLNFLYWNAGPVTARNLAGGVSTEQP